MVAETMYFPVVTTLRVYGLIALVVVSCAQARKAVDLVIENVTVIDPASRRVLPDQFVTIAQGRIRAVQSRRDGAGVGARSTLDGTHRFLIPGLLDMHVHLTTKAIRDQPQVTLDLLLANGVTGVRDLAADCWEPRQEGAVCIKDMRRLARRITAGKVVGPRLLALSSAIVRGVWDRDRLPEGAEPYLAPATAQEAQALVRYLDRRGVDLVKTYHTIPREAYFALLAEASDRGLEVSGHIPLGVSVLEASRAGHRTVEHARDLPIACGRYSSEYRETWHLVLLDEPGPDPPDARTRLENTFSAFDESFCRDVLTSLAANGTYLVPTHGTRELDARGGELSYRNDPRLRYVPSRLRQKWDEELDATAEAAPRLSALYLELYELGIRLTGMAHEEGVRVMVGTDANDTMIFAGFGFHDELERFAQAGIAPMEILRAATTVPAEYLGRADDLGGISAGRLADLILLRADPLADIGNSREIEAVILGGRVYDRPALDAMLRRVEKRVGSQ